VDVTAGRILVVEDDADTRHLLYDVLVGAGFEVQTAAHGGEALRLLRSIPPDAIILDLILPWINGVDVLSVLRSDPNLVSVPVVVITATAAAEADLATFRPLMVVRKPFDVEDLVVSVQRMISGSPLIT
jgi:DNA-binding response OmpR family regulator